MRHYFLILSICVICVICGPTSSPAAQDHPNILVILTDDQGWGDLSLNGNTNLQTPNIDSIAHDGAMFDRFYVCSVCAPTRAEFLTGRYYPRTGVRGVSTGQERLNPDETTIADTFKAAGYATGAFGKWHNGSQHPYHPNARGFEEYVGFTSGHWGHYFDAALEHNGEFFKSEGYITDYFTTRAIDFIKENKDQPFFCYVPYCTPHSPMQVPDEFFDKFSERPLEMRNREPEREDEPHLRAALAMCENIDFNVGRLLETLKKENLTDDTIVLFFTDNGPNGVRWNGGMKGRKGSIDEGGIRVPLLVRWPGHIKPGTDVKHIAGAIDLLPTLADLAGIPMISEKPLDGLSLKPLLLEENPEWQSRPILSYRGGKKGAGPQFSVRNQKYRLDATGALFDINADPGQYKDIAADHPDVTAKLTKIANKFKKEIAADITEDDRPYSVGHSETTPLPARDGINHGGIERSNRAPNDSFFTNWTSTDDKITWNIEVAEPGDYEATIYYTCADENTGAEINLTFQNESLPFTITEAHDPPLRGEESDRSDRGTESFVKDWKVHPVGTIHLDKTQGDITLQATKIPGEAAIDVRYLMLKKI
ncbi:MAG: arylsulfatase [Verrucomicrobiota bacterium]